MLTAKSNAKKFAVKAEEKDLNVYGLKVGKNGNAIVYVERKEDLDALVQSYKESCGLDAMLKLLNRGMITAQSLADDGQHSGDGTIPTELGPASLVVGEKVAESEALMKALGLTAEDLNSDDLTGKVREAIQKIAAQQAQEVPGNGEQ